MMKYLLSIIIFATVLNPVFGKEPGLEDPVAKLCERVNFFLEIRDYKRAGSLAEEVLEQFPDSILAYKTCMKSYALQGKGDIAIDTWKVFSQKFSSIQYDEEVLENLAWAIIHMGYESEHFPVRMISLVAGGLTRDIPGLKMTCESLQDPHYFIQGTALKLASLFPDQMIKEGVLSLLQYEKNSLIRLEAIQLTKTLHIKESEPILYQLLSNNFLTYEEKIAATEALLSFNKEKGSQHIDYLINQNRSGLRILASKMIANNPQKNNLDYLYQLFEDKQKDVLIHAIYTAGVLRLDENKTQELCAHLEALHQNTSSEIAALTAWALCRHGKYQYMDILESTILGEEIALRRQISSALPTLGKQASNSLLSCMQQSEDPYVRLNLALGLIQHQCYLSEACLEIEGFLTNNQDKVMFDDREGFFERIVPSNKLYDPMISNYPELVNSWVRLHLIRILCELSYSKAFELLEQFFSENELELSNLALFTLIKEKGQQSFVQMREFLYHRNPKLRYQAALVLAFMSKDREAIKVLESLYFNLSYPEKLQVLEALAYIGDKKSLPFLLKVMDEPFQTLKIMGACALIRSLNN